MEFCDHPNSSDESLRHNTLSPNKQNQLCNLKSAWEVMSEHSDFKESEWCYFHTHTHLKLINVYAFDSWPFGVKILIKLLSAISDK